MSMLASVNGTGFLSKTLNSSMTRTSADLFSLGVGAVWARAHWFAIVANKQHAASVPVRSVAGGRSATTGGETTGRASRADAWMRVRAWDEFMERFAEWA